jgi:hypothetical protein
MTQTVHFLHQKVNILLSDSLIGYDASEEVGQFALRLVSHHQSSSRHHPSLENGRNLFRAYKVIDDDSISPLHL